MNTKGRTERESPDPAKDMDDRRPDGSVGHERLGGGKHEGVQESSMMECVLDRENLDRAWKRVRANDGAPGVDRQSFEHIEHEIGVEVFLAGLREELRCQGYRPLPGAAVK